MPSIKQVFLLKPCRAVPWCRRYKSINLINRREQAPALRQKEYGQFVRTPFHTPCLARYSVLHLLGVLSGADEPPLCKGRWLAQARRRDCKSKKFIVKQSLSRLRRQLPLHKGAFSLCVPKVRLLFLTSTALVDTKAKPRARRGKKCYLSVLI